MIIKKVLAEAKGFVERTHALVDYIVTAATDDGDEKCLHYEGFNFFSEDPELMKAELLGLVAASESPLLMEKNILRHWVMSWNDKEMPTADEISSAAKMFLNEMGLGEHQAVIGVHINTENIHVHMAVSRMNPETHTLSDEWNDAIKSHAVLTGIERAMKADPERNALYTFNVREGITPNPHYKPRNSISFAYASPETVVVEMPAGSPPPEFNSMKRKGDCWYYKGYPNTAAAVMYDDRMYFFNWAYKDTVLDIKSLKNFGGKIIVQQDLAPVFFDYKLSKKRQKAFKDYVKATFLDDDKDVFTGLTEVQVPYDTNVYIRKRPPTFPMEVRDLRHKHSPRRFYQKAKMFYDKKGVPPLKIHSMVCMHMRAHSFPRRNIEECLRMDGLTTNYAKHITRWLYSHRGNMEMFRQRMQGTLVLEKEAKLKKLPKIKTKKTRFRLSFDHYGNLLTNGKLFGRPGKNMHEKMKEKTNSLKLFSKNKSTKLNKDDLEFK